MTIQAYIPGTKAWSERRARELCEKTGARIQEIVDEEIGNGRTARELRRHLEDCERCRGEADVIRTLKEAIVRLAGDVDERTLDRLQTLVEELSAED